MGPLKQDTRIVESTWNPETVHFPTPVLSVLVCRLRGVPPTDPMKPNTGTSPAVKSNLATKQYVVDPILINPVYKLGGFRAIQKLFDSPQFTQPKKHIYTLGLINMGSTLPGTKRRFHFLKAQCPVYCFLALIARIH